MSENVKMICSKTAICPFYKKEGPTHISCEGQTDDNTIHIVFKTKKAILTYKSKYCYSFKYTNCRIAKMLLEKYGIKTADQ